MVELDSYSSADRSDSVVSYDKAQALEWASPEATPPTRLAAGSIASNMMRATR
jgi:hypothetical protein